MLLPVPPSRKAEWGALQACLFLALLLHAVALFAWIVLGGARERPPTMRVVARVDVVDRLVRPQAPKPPPPRRLAVPAPTLGGGGGGGNLGNRPLPTRPAPVTRTNPQAPPLPAPTVGSRYPTGPRSSGTGGGSGGGQGTGQGTGTGGGEGPGSGGGSGGGDVPMEPPPEPRISDAEFVVTDSGIQPTTVVVPEGNVVITMRNDANSPMSLKVEGQGGELYGSRIADVPTHEEQSFTIALKEGWYTITIPERHFAPGFVARMEVRREP